MIKQEYVRPKLIPPKEISKIWTLTKDGATQHDINRALFYAALRNAKIKPPL